LTSYTFEPYGPGDMTSAPKSARLAHPMKLATWVKPLLSAVIFVTVLAPGADAAAKDDPKDKAGIITRSFPAKSGVSSEAEIVIDASAEKVANVLSDPKNFIPLLPAHSINVLKSSPEAQVVAIEMRKPWPIGTVKWIEDVVSFRDPDGKSYVVERNAQSGGFFKRLSARWRVMPHPDSESERCVVTYYVSMEPGQWAPEWMLRRGNLTGIVDTLARLRRFVDTAATVPALAHQ